MDFSLGMVFWLARQRCCTIIAAPAPPRLLVCFYGLDGDRFIDFNGNSPFIFAAMTWVCDRQLN